MTKFLSVLSVLMASVLLLGFIGCSSNKLKTNAEPELFKLPDGSVVVLNSGSEISYSINSEERNIELKGEAHFSVQRGDVPFVVKTNYGMVRVLGTAFNINSSNEVFDVEVDEGEVEVSVNNEKEKLKKGERVLYDDAKKLFKRGKAEFKHHIWTDDFKGNMKDLDKEIKKGGKKLRKGLKKLGKDIEKKFD